MGHSDHRAIERGTLALLRRGTTRTVGHRVAWLTVFGVVAVLMVELWRIRVLRALVLGLAFGATLALVR